MNPEVLEMLRQAAQQPQGLAVLTGAGVSAESGIPTFRDALLGALDNMSTLGLT